MSKIVLEYKEKEYELEFTRRTIRIMEKNGFDIQKADEQVINTMEALFKGAFLAHHPKLASSTVDEIWQATENKRELIQALVELYNEPLDAMFKEPDKDSKNHARWKKN